MERVLSNSNSYETASIADNVLHLFTQAELPTLAYLTKLLDDLTSAQGELTHSIGVENQDDNSHKLRLEDDSFDKEFQCFKSFVDANQTCGQKEIEQAAEVILRKLELHSRTLYRFSYESELVAFRSLRNDLHEIDTFTLLNKLWGAPESFFRLEQKADSVQKLYREREIALAEKEEITPSKMLRKGVRDLVNDGVIGFLEVHRRMQPDVYGEIASRVDQFVETINSQIRNRMNDSSSSTPENKDNPIDE